MPGSGVTYLWHLQEVQQLHDSRRELQTRLDSQGAELQEQRQAALKAAESARHQEDAARSSASGQLLQLQQVRG